MTRASCSPDFATTNVPAAELPAWLSRVEPFAFRATRRRPLLTPGYARRVARGADRRDRPGAQLLRPRLGARRHTAAGRPHVTYLDRPAALAVRRAGTATAATSRWRCGPLQRAALPWLRARHARLARRADRVLTNSSASAAGLGTRYGIAAEVVHPPVRTAFFTPAPRERRHVLVVSRLVAHKRVDEAIEAARLAGLPAVVVGGGRRLEQLRAGAGRHATFTGWVDDERLRELYRSAVALVCPSVEEFGIVMAEALACGTPVVAPRAGGALGHRRQRPRRAAGRRPLAARARHRTARPAARCRRVPRVPAGASPRSASSGARRDPGSRAGHRRYLRRRRPTVAASTARTTR